MRENEITKAEFIAYLDNYMNKKDINASLKECAMENDMNYNDILDYYKKHLKSYKLDRLVFGYKTKMNLERGGLCIFKKFSPNRLGQLFGKAVAKLATSVEKQTEELMNKNPGRTKKHMRTKTDDYHRYVFVKDIYNKVLVKRMF